MGFSPGDFKDRFGAELHWELKDGPRIVLWDAHEMRKLVDFDLKGATRAAELLNLLVAMAREE